LEGSSNAQLGSKGRGERCDIVSLKEDASFSGAILPGDHIKESSLSCSIRTDNGFKCAGEDLKIDVIYGNMTAEANGKVFGFNDWSLPHIVRKNFYKIPARLPLPKGGEIVSPLRKNEKRLPPFSKGG